MIISLEDAKTHYPQVTQDHLDGLEASIRKLTNHNFQHRDVRLHDAGFNGDIIQSRSPTIGFVAGQTVQVSKSVYNDGLYVIDEIVGGGLRVKDHTFITSSLKGAFVTLVVYPPDIKSGVVKLLKYDAKMSDKLGIKSQTVARMRTDYYDTSCDSVEGYPSAMWDFLDKHLNLRW